MSVIRHSEGDRCPHGHDFPPVVPVGCTECDGLVACEPVAHGLRLRDQLAGVVEDNERLERLAATWKLAEGERNAELLEARAEIARLRAAAGGQ
jgi:hypothetical protein